ncbi:citrate lyase beta subunit [Nannochloropsis gaditana]|uniref:Citrate lyase beta subunit n=1 Tax=Nannochloropsis gaditana TaxID=72520 RepID=W7T1J4_9STRA|nr:citrate lyase beta subunit [Nannochloropsis gaditana]
MGIWAMVETPAAVMNIKEIARSANFVPRLEALMMGTSDLTNELHALHHPDRVPLLYSLSSCLVAARAFKLRVIDGVHLNLNDPNGFAAACAQGRALGFDGKSLIHPKTVAEANKAFGPRPDELAHAERVLTAWREAQAHGEAIPCLG